jgi:hypothetical protein
MALVDTDNSKEENEAAEESEEAEMGQLLA